MRTSRQSFDDLAAHISIFYSNIPSSSSKSSPRKAILSWFSKLSLHQRQACLTIVDSNFVKILLQMNARLQNDGCCHFFLLPDLPSYPGSSLPSLCHRQLEGLLSRISAPNESERLICSSVYLFGSQDGEPGGEYGLDSMLISEELLVDIELFAKVMDEISGGGFLREAGIDKSPTDWIELEWLKAKGYYSMASFIANKVELAMRVSWEEHSGRKKTRAGRMNNKVAQAGVEANAFWRQKGCLDWWQELDAEFRRKVFQIFLCKGARVLVKEIIQKRMADMKDELASCWTRTKQAHLYKSTSVFKRMSQLCCSLDLEFFLGMDTGTNSSKPSPLANLINSVLVLQEISVSMLTTVECESQALFFSKLDSVNDVSQFILRRLRWFLISLWREYIKVELTGNFKLHKQPHAEGILVEGVCTVNKNDRISKKRNPSTKPSKSIHQNNGDTLRNKENPKPKNCLPRNFKSSVISSKKSSSGTTSVEDKEIPESSESQHGTENTKKPRSGRKRNKSKASRSSKATKSQNSKVADGDFKQRTEEKDVFNAKFSESRVSSLQKDSVFEANFQRNSFQSGLGGSLMQKRMATKANSSTAVGLHQETSCESSKNLLEKLDYQFPAVISEKAAMEECRETIDCETIAIDYSKANCKAFWSEDEADKRNLKITAENKPRSITNHSQRHSPLAGILHLDSNSRETSFCSLDANNLGKVTVAKGNSHLVVSPRALPMSFDWPLMVRGCTRVTQSLPQSFDAACSSTLPAFCRPSVDSHEGPMRCNVNEWMHDKDHLDFDEFQSASELLEDSESYWVSEDESDLHALRGRDYSQFFGGGVMYWNTSDYVGAGFSQAPSYSSEDSSWARHEADLNRAVDDMVGFIFPGNDAGGLRSEEKDTSSEGLNVESHSEPQLRPITIPNMSRKGSRSEFKVKLNCSSPRVTSTRGDFSRIKRPSSPVVLCVHRNPRPAMTSVGDSQKHRDFPVVRSGSSSPKSWSVRNLHHGEYATTGTRKCLDGGELIWTTWQSNRCVGSPVTHTVPGLLVQDQLRVISHCDQDHPDVALPIRVTDSSCPFYHERLALLHNLLHGEIDSFCKKVAAENLTRKPYINWAVKRVTKSLQVLWPRSRTNIFGSIATGLALPSSDVDLVICLPPVRNLEPIKEAGILEGRNGIKETCLQHAARYLANQDWVKNDSLKTIENTAIPLIMLIAEVPLDIIEAHCHDSFGSNDLNVLNDDPLLSCSGSRMHSVRLDISFRSSTHTGLQTTELIRELTEQFPASIPLALVLKQFLADRNLDRSYSGGLSSHCLVLLIIRFLQHERHVSGSNSHCLGSLFTDFLYFFGNVFDPRQMHVSIHGSGVYMKRERGHSIDPLHIDDPLCPTNNVGKNCFRIHQCIKAFADAYSIMDRQLSSLADISDSKGLTPFTLLRKIIPSIDGE